MRSNADQLFIRCDEAHLIPLLRRQAIMSDEGGRKLDGIERPYRMWLATSIGAEKRGCAQKYVGTECDNLVSRVFGCGRDKRQMTLKSLNSRVGESRVILEDAL